MRKDNNTVTRRLGVRNKTGTGYVYIPSDKNKKTFINYCIRTNTICLLLEEGGYVENVPVTNEVINNLVFPDEKGGIGSWVTWINYPKHNLPLVIGTLPKVDEITNFHEDIAVFKRNTKDYTSSITVDAKNGQIIINAFSSKEIGGDIVIQSINGKKKSKIKLQASEKVEIDSISQSHTLRDEFKIVIKDLSIDDKESSIIYKKGEGLTILDEFENNVILNKDNIQIKSGGKKIVLQDGKEPLVLGDTLQSLMEQLIVQVEAIVVPTAFGPSGVPVNIPAFEGIKNQLSTMLSKISKTD